MGVRRNLISKVMFGVVRVLLHTGAQVGDAGPDGLITALYLSSSDRIILYNILSLYSCYSSVVIVASSN